MGLLKKLGGAIGGAVKGVVNGVKDYAQDAYDGTVGKVGDLLEGNSGSGTSLTNHDKAYSEVYSETMSRLKDAYFKEKGKNVSVLSLAYQQMLYDAEKYMQSSEGKAAVAKIESQLNSGLNINGATIKQTLGSILDSALTGVKAGLSDSLKDAVSTGISKGTTSLFGSKPAKSVSNTISDYASTILGKTFADTLKKYWWAFIIPFGFMLLLCIRLIKSIFSKGGKTTTKGRVRTAK